MKNEYLTETPFLCFSNDKLKEFAKKVTEDCKTDKEKAIALYYAVRDGWKYNPYRISFRVEDWTASTIFERPDGHCQDKSILLITLARACGIPARLHLAKVKNHIAVEKLTEKFGTNILTPHGYMEFYINEKWVKATPAFNKKLCERMGVSPLEFDGETDSYFQEYDAKGSIFMEYLEDYGTFADVPLDFMKKNIVEHYPEIAKKYAHKKVVDFQKEK